MLYSSTDMREPIVSGKRDVPSSAPGASTTGPARPSASAADAHGTPPHGVPREEDSGLHDIRSLARGTIQRVSKERPAVVEDELSGLTKRPSAVLATPGAEVATSTPVTTSGLTPSAPTKRRSPWPIVVVGALAAAGGAFAATKFLAKPAVTPAPIATPSEVTPTPPPVDPVVTPQPVVTPGAPGTEAATIPPTVPPQSTSPSDGDKTGDKTEKHKKDEKKAEEKSVAKDAEKKDGDKAPEATAALAPAATPTTPAAEVKKEKPAPGSLDELLNEASGPAQAPTETAPVAPVDDTLPEKLSRDDVRNGMLAVKNQVQACFDQYKVAGMYSVKLTIDPSGTVKSADYVTDGDTTKLESGTCVVAAVKAAAFKKWRGASLTLTYPFKLQ